MLSSRRRASVTCVLPCLLEGADVGGQLGVEPDEEPAPRGAAASRDVPRGGRCSGLDTVRPAPSTGRSWTTVLRWSRLIVICRPGLAHLDLAADQRVGTE